MLFRDTHFRATFISEHSFSANFLLQIILRNSQFVNCCGLLVRRERPHIRDVTRAPTSTCHFVSRVETRLTDAGKWKIAAGQSQDTQSLPPSRLSLQLHHSNKRGGPRINTLHQTGEHIAPQPANQAGQPRALHTAQQCDASHT